MKIKVKVYPHSGKEEIIHLSENDYKVYLKKPPIENKANIELLKFLKRYFKKEVRLIKGANSRDKIIEIN
ncbi:MAG: DUF167 domain-containing protein [Candidatus Pacearchaeota archaeon]|jgi:uncharacterized protein (TIGR00251 family)